MARLRFDSAAYTQPVQLPQKMDARKTPAGKSKPLKFAMTRSRNASAMKGRGSRYLDCRSFPCLACRIRSATKIAAAYWSRNLSFDSTNGVAVSIPYYFNLAPNEDATVTDSGLYRGSSVDQRYISKSETKKAHSNSPATPLTDRVSPLALSGPLPDAEKDFRGYFATSGRFILDENWTISQSARLVSDRTFLRRYDISDDDSLRSTINVERIDDSSYFSLAGWAFQTLRAGDPQNRVPIALPVVDYRKRFAEPVLGGSTQIQVNSLAIGRTEGQDTQRAFASARWDLRKLTTLGRK